MSPAALDAVFRATTYQVVTEEGCFDLRIGVLHPVFDGYLERRGYVHWTILSADNPFAIGCPEGNPVRRAALRARLETLDIPHLTTRHVADDGGWPDEIGCLLLGCDDALALALAAELRQSAVVCGQSGGAPRLVWTIPMGA